MKHVTEYNINTMTLTARCTADVVELDAVFEANTEEIRRNAEGLEQISERDKPKGRAMSAFDAGCPPHQPQSAQVVYMVMRSRDRSVRRVGWVTKPNGRMKRYSQNVFENQATMVVRMPSGTHTNVKLFRNGHIQMTGARSELDGVEAARAVMRAVGGAWRRAVHDKRSVPHGAAIDDALLAAPPGAATDGADVAAPNGAAPPDIRGCMNVCLMNSDFRLLGGKVDRQKFYEVATATYGVQSSFQPAIYPAVKCFFMWRPETGDGTDACLPYPRAGVEGRGTRPDSRPTAPDCDGVCPLERRGGSGSRGCDGKGCCKRVTVLIFHTGAAIVTGAVTEAQIQACHAWVSRACAEHGNEFLICTT
jgi:hypothetical protein